MLRYSSSFVQSTATVREELWHAKAYLEIMKSRYDYMITCSISMDEALADISIPKLIIQPLCENCFTHAFASIEPPYRVGIKVEGTPEKWSIRVDDNGEGFSAKARMRILERANNSSYEDLNRMQIGGLGLISSVVRLKLHTQRRIECEILEASPGSSVIIAIQGD
jgi:sensor histidine kinase YesM